MKTLQHSKQKNLHNSLFHVLSLSTRENPINSIQTRGKISFSTFFPPFLTGFLSMWISNTATTAMMIPIVEAIAQVSAEPPPESVEESTRSTRPTGQKNNPTTGENAPLAIPDDSLDEPVDTDPIVEFKVVDEGSENRPVVLQEIGKQPSKFFMSETQKKAKIERQRNLLLLAVAYSANIGGTGVITGSPPNLVVPQVMEGRFGDSTGLTFASWMAFAVPVMSINLIISWIWIAFLGWKEEKKHRIPGEENLDPKKKERAIMQVMRQKYEALGPIKCHELSVLVCFVVVILLWFFRRPLFMFGK